jgi:hypothetical protein
MGEAANYFRRERFITRRLSLLVLGGTAVLLPVALNVTRGRLPAMVLPYTVIGVVIGVAALVILIVRRAHALYPKSPSQDWSPLDDVTCRKLRRRILILKSLVGIYAFILVSSVIQMHRREWPGILALAVVIVIMEFALVKAIRRLTMKLKAGTILLRNTLAS